MNKHEIDMTEGRILPKLLRFLLPLMLASVLQLAFNAADLIVVGRFGSPTALAAVGSNFVLVTLVVNTFLGLSIGAGVLSARYFGAQDRASLRETTSTALLLAVSGGAVLGAAGVAAAKLLLRLIGSPPDVAPLALVYLRIYFSGLPVIALYNFSAALLRGVGDTRRPFRYLTAAGVVNVCLNLFFVLVLRIDVAGVALATVLSQCMSAFLTARCLLNTQELRIRQLRPNRKLLREMLRIGLPAGVQGALYSISNTVIQSAVNSYGSAVMTGCSAGVSLEAFLFCPVDACQQGATTAVSQNVGANKPERSARAAWQCLALGAAIGLVGGAFLYLLRTPLLRLYTTDPAALEAAYIRMRVLMRFQAFNALMAVFSGIIRGLGHSTLPAVVTFLGCCVLRIAWVYTVYAAAPSLERLLAVYPASWMVTTAVHFVCYLLIRRKMRRETPELSP